MKNSIDELMQKLSLMQKELKKIQNITSINKKIEIMRTEIINIGWNGIINKYHPDINYKEPAAQEVFEMYKTLYNMMKNNGEI